MSIIKQEITTPNGDIIRDKALQEFFDNGGTVKGAIKGTEGTTGHRFFEHTGIFNSRNALIRTSSANSNGYPSILNMIEDLDDPSNSNGIVFLLGNGKSGDSYRNSFLRPVNNAYGSGTMNLGSPSFPFDDLHLTGVSKASNGYTKLPNGMIIQWGQTVVFGTSGINIILPIAFPTMFTSIITTPYTMNNFYSDTRCVVGSRDRTAFTLWGNVEQRACWIAIGY